VAAEMDEVEGAEFAGDLNDAHVAGGAGEDGDAGDVRAGETKPEVGDGGVGLGGVGGGLVGVDEMLPSGSVVAGDDRGHGLRDVEGRTGVAIVVDGEAGDGGRCAIRVKTTGGQKILRCLEFRTVETDGEMGGWLVREVHQGTLEVGWDGTGGLSVGEGQRGGEKSGEQECTETCGHRGLFPVRHGFYAGVMADGKKLGGRFAVSRGCWFCLFRSILRGSVLRGPGEWLWRRGG